MSIKHDQKKYKMFLKNKEIEIAFNEYLKDKFEVAKDPKDLLKTKEIKKIIEDFWSVKYSLYVNVETGVDIGGRIKNIIAIDKVYYKIFEKKKFNTLTPYKINQIAIKNMLFPQVSYEVL